MVRETTLLGTVITDRLTWDRNTEELVKKGYKQMRLLHAAAAFTSNRKELKDIFFDICTKYNRTVCCCMAQQPFIDKQVRRRKGAEGCSEGDYGKQL